MHSFPIPSISGPKSVLALATIALLLALPTVARADAAQCAALRPEVPADYYGARGCGLLRSVEQFHLQPGFNHMKARRFLQANNDFRFILNQFPNHPQALLAVAQNCEFWPITDRERGNRCTIDELFDRAVEINPKSASTFVARGTYEHRSKRYDKAVASFIRAVELDPDSPNANYNLGLAYLEARQYDKANAYAQRAYELGSQLPGLRNRLQQVGQWRPGVTPPATQASSATAGSTPGAPGSGGPPNAPASQSGGLSPGAAGGAVAPAR